MQERAEAPREHSTCLFFLNPHLCPLGLAFLPSGDLVSGKWDLKGVAERTDPGPAGECREGLGTPPAESAEMGDRPIGRQRVWTEPGPGRRRDWTVRRNTAPAKGNGGPSERGWVQPPRSPRGECGEAVGLGAATSPSQAADERPIFPGGKQTQSCH